MKSRHRSFGVTALTSLLAAGILAAGIFSTGRAEDVDHPAFASLQKSTVVVVTEVPDIPKLEAKAIEILRRPGTVTGERMTLTEARAYLRADANGNQDPKGRTDVARCLQIVYIDRIRGIVQATVTGVTVVGAHPQPKADPVPEGAQ